MSIQGLSTVLILSECEMFCVPNFYVQFHKTSGHPIILQQIDILDGWYSRHLLGTTPSPLKNELKKKKKKTWYITCKYLHENMEKNNKVYISYFNFGLTLFKKKQIKARMWYKQAQISWLPSTWSQFLIFKKRLTRRIKK